MPYVLISPETAEDFNRGLCRLLRPTSLRDGSYVTDLYCQMLTHPSNGWMALVLPDTQEVPIHVAADGSELEAVLDIFVTDEALTQGEADAIMAAVVANAGQEIVIADFIPAGWTANVLTYEDMVAGGWFA